MADEHELYKRPVHVGQIDTAGMHMHLQQQLHDPRLHLDQQMANAMQQPHMGSVASGPDLSQFLTGFQPPSAAPREKEILELAIKLTEFLKPLDNQVRHAIWELAQNTLRLTLSQDQAAERELQAVSAERASLSNKLRAQRFKSQNNDEDDEEEDD